MTEIDDLKNYHKNPRRMTRETFELLSDSLKEFGDLSGIVRNIKTDELVGGNQRTNFFKQDPDNVEIVISEKFDKPTKTGTVALGYIIYKGEKFSYREVDWEVEKEERANILANKVSGAWDFDILANEFGMDLLLETGWTNEDLGFFDDVVKDGLTDDDEIPEVKKAICKTGDLWLLGEHRLLCGDATKKEDVERLMDGQKADMVFTDPPYGIGYEYNSHKDNKGLEYLEFCDKWFENIEKLSELKIIFIGWAYNKFWFNKEPYDVFYWIVKNKHSGGKNSHFRNTEPILMWGRFKKQFDFDYIFLDSIKRVTGPAGVHTCPKPVEVLVDFVNRVNKNGIIIDTFLGSGSTLIACEKTGRKCYGMEIDPHYCDVIIKRWEDYTGKTAENESR